MDKPLHRAAIETVNTDILNYLIDHGADVNAKDGSGETPLHVAAQWNSNVDILNYLIDHGADVNAKDGSDETPLHGAVQWNSNVDILNCLIAHGADINAKNEYGQTPLHLASVRNAIVQEYDRLWQIDDIRRIFSSTEELEFWSKSYAFENRHGMILRSIRKTYLTLSSLLSELCSTITFYCKLFKICFFGIDKKYLEKMRKSHSESLPDSIVILACLIDNGADVNAKSVDGFTPLHCAVEENPFPPDIQFLIERGAKVDEQDKQGQTPLHWAVNVHSWSAIFILLEAGASKDIKDAEGMTPYDILKKQSENEYRTYFRRYKRIELEVLMRLLR